ncbi:MAG TPA: S1/P1 nuclease [Pyrinomonadaceae bacterium]
MKKYVRLSAQLCLAACLVSLLPARAVAWGGPGHRIVARIAAWRLKQLNARNAQRQINRIFTAQPDQKTDPRNIVTAAAWPDSPAVRDNKDYEFANDLHFISIPRKKSSIDASTPCRATGDVEEGVCITGGIEHFRRRLLNTKDPHERRDALSFIVHFVGDIHQPLHTSEDLDFNNGKGDRGGNFRTVCYLNESVCTSPDVNSCQKDPSACSIVSNNKRKRRELHKVWDNFMFETEMESRQLTEEQYADHLIKTRAARLTDAMLADIERGDPAAWAEESHALALSVVYDLPAPLRKMNPDGKMQDHYFVSRQYRDANVARAEEQLVKAGLRLAMYLRQIYPDN